MADDRDLMLRAVTLAAGVRSSTSPNPWVGAVIVAGGEIVAVGATEPVGGRHAEIVALDAAGAAARGSTLVCTLEPCSHHGRTPPCVERIVAAGVRRVVIGVEDPDPKVAGSGVSALRSAGIDVITGVAADVVGTQLAPYLHHRRTRRPYVVAKMAMTVDGATAAADGSSRWITGDEARRDVHRLRAESDAVVVGAGTVRADDPALTVRHVEGRDPLRVVLGCVSPTARVRPCREWSASIEELLDDLGRQGIVQVMVEGGARVLAAFHERGLIDRYVIYVAPALLGGSGGRPLLDGVAAPTIDGLWRGRIDVVERVGADLRIEMVP